MGMSENNRSMNRFCTFATGLLLLGAASVEGLDEYDRKKKVRERSDIYNKKVEEIRANLAGMTDTERLRFSTVLHNATNDAPLSLHLKLLDEVLREASTPKTIPKKLE